MIRRHVKVNQIKLQSLRIKDGIQQTDVLHEIKKKPEPFIRPVDAFIFLLIFAFRVGESVVREN